MSNRISNKVGTIFSRYYRSMLKITSKMSWRADTAFELIPAMYVVCDIATACANNDREMVSNAILSELQSLYPNIDIEKFGNRIDLYGEIIRGKKLRCEFTLGAKDTWNSHPVMMITALWGDIIVNPACADDYDSAPVIIRGLDQTFAFLTEIIKPILNEMSGLYKEIYAL